MGLIAYRRIDEHRARIGEVTVLEAGPDKVE
jgi:hypothetical protein